MKTEFLKPLLLSNHSKPSAMLFNVEEIIAVATEAVRKAENKTEFIGPVKSEPGIDIKILTGAEEAYYDYFGVINSMYVDNSQIIDIGGSSTELAWLRNNKLIKSVSLPLGEWILPNDFTLEI